MQCAQHFYPILTKSEISRQIVIKSSNIKCHEYLSSDSRRRTDELPDTISVKESILMLPATIKCMKLFISSV